MNFIDTHTHLFLKQFERDIDNVIERATASGVNKMLLPNISSETTNTMMDVCQKYPNNCFPMMGLHPCEVKKESMQQQLTHVQQMLEKERFVAVGEIGLDLYWGKTTLDIQKAAFSFQIQLAKKHQLPIVIHVRESFNEAIEIVEELNDENLRGVFHCFTGSKEDANRIIELENFYLGIGGVLTFKNAGLDKTIEQLNLEHLILETDSPYLAPTPFRGKRNESKYIKQIAEKLAEVKHVSLEEVAKITTKNANHLFNIF